MPFIKVIDQSVLEIGQLDAINKSDYAVQKYIYSETASASECVVSELPEIGSLYKDQFDEPDMTDQMMVYKIECMTNNGQQEFLVHAKSYGDVYDRGQFEFTLGGNIIAIQPKEDDPTEVEDEIWYWDSTSDDDPRPAVKQPIYKTSMSGTVTVTQYIPASEYKTYIGILKGCMGKINDENALTHPGLSLFKEGELLLNTVSNGTRFPGRDNLEYVSFDLTFSFRLLDDDTILKDTWQYLYRYDGDVYDKPKIKDSPDILLYETANFNTLLNHNDPAITITDKVIDSDQARLLLDGYSISEDNGGQSMNKNANATQTWITNVTGDLDPGESVCVAELPKIGSVYQEHSEYPNSLNMTCTKIRREGLTDNRFKYLVTFESKTNNVDKADFSYSGGGEVISLVPTVNDDGVLYDDWLWKWDSDEEPVMNAVYKSCIMGSIIVNRIVPVLNYPTWITDVRDAAGRINSVDYTTLDAFSNNYALNGFKPGQLLFNSVSGGRRTCDEFGKEVYEFQLMFAYRIVGGEVSEDDWQYIYRKDTGKYDMPISETWDGTTLTAGYLYQKSDFGGL